MSTTKRLILVDDDIDLCSMLSEYLRAEGFSVDCAHDGELGQERLLSGRYDLAILDVMLPKRNGIDVVRNVRTLAKIPIIMLTAKATTVDRIVGLELGADDYLSKPFDARELLARINTVLRRSQQMDAEGLVTSGDLRIASGSRTAVLRNQPLELTSAEFDLLVVLATKSGKVVTRDELSKQLGRELLPYDRSIDMHIVSLRRKLDATGLAAPQILTVRGLGYQLSSGSRETP